VEDPKKLREALYEPMAGASPERVPEQVIQDEMSAFMNLTRETGR
jgi:hypothetical protein